MKVRVLWVVHLSVIATMLSRRVDATPSACGDPSLSGAVRLACRLTSDDNKKDEARIALFRLGRPGIRSLEAVLRGNGDPIVRDAALFALQQLALTTRLLKQVAARPDRAEVERATPVLAELARLEPAITAGLVAAVPTLTLALDADDLRRNAAQTLGMLAASAVSAIPALIKAGASKDPTVRMSVAIALGEIAKGGDDKGVRQQLEHMTSDTDAEVRARATNALAMMKTSPR